MTLAGAVIVGGTVALAASSGTLPILVFSAATAYAGSRFVENRMRKADQLVCEDRAKAIRRRLENSSSWRERQELELELDAVERGVSVPGGETAAATAGALFALGSWINPVAGIAAMTSMAGGRKK